MLAGRVADPYGAGVGLVQACSGVADSSSTNVGGVLERIFGGTPEVSDGVSPTIGTSRLCVVRDFLTALHLTHGIREDAIRRHAHTGVRR